MRKNLKTVSKESFSLSHEGNPTLEEVNTSCLMRIAEAVEMTAQNYSKLLQERDRFERWWREETARNKKLSASNNSLRGVITRMKNQKSS